MIVVDVADGGSGKRGMCFAAVDNSSTFCEVLSTQTDNYETTKIGSKESNVVQLDDAKPFSISFILATSSCTLPPHKPRTTKPRYASDPLDFTLAMSVLVPQAPKLLVHAGPKWPVRRGANGAPGLPFDRSHSYGCCRIALFASVLVVGRTRQRWFLRRSRVKRRSGSEEGSESSEHQDGSDSAEDAFLSDTQSLDSQILSLAGPALVALCAEPVLSIIDTGFVGRLPNAALCLGGLGCPATILASLFLALFFRVVGGC